MAYTDAELDELIRRAFDHMHACYADISRAMDREHHIGATARYVEAKAIYNSLRILRSQPEVAPEDRDYGV